MLQPNTPFKRLFGSMNIAAYLTWLAVLIMLVGTPDEGFLISRGVALAAVVGYLLAFAVNALVDDDSPWTRVLLTVEALFALTACAVWPHTGGPILTVIFVVGAAMCLSAPALVFTAIAVNVSLWCIAYWAWGYVNAWQSLLAFAGFHIFATLTAWYARQANEASLALREANAHLLATRSLLEESARDRERLHLARELHDVAGHKLTALKLNLTALQREGGQAPQVDVAAQLATELLADIRGVLAQIRKYDGLDIRTALNEIVAPFPAPPRIHLEIAEDARVDNVAQAETLLRVVQEAITNVVRHSGAQNAWVLMRREGDAIRLQVRDDGRGQVPLREGFGLAGMRERLALLGGSLGISRAEQGGIALEIQVPAHA